MLQTYVISAIAGPPQAGTLSAMHAAAISCRSRSADRHPHLERPGISCPQKFARLALTQHPLPAGQGQAVELAQLHLRLPELPALGQMQ